MDSTLLRSGAARAPLLLALFSPACGDSAVPSPPPRRDLDRDVLDVGLEVDISTRRATASITLNASQSTGASFETSSPVARLPPTV